MGAVLVALVLLMMLPGPGPDPDAPPPAADGGASAGERRGAGRRRQALQLQFTLKDMNGVDVNLASFKGKVLLINFWATWCGPCRVEIPALIELQKQYRDDLVVLGIDVLDEFSRAAAVREGNESELSAARWQQAHQDFEEAYGPFWGLPVTVFVGRDGKFTRSTQASRRRSSSSSTSSRCCSMIPVC